VVVVGDIVVVAIVVVVVVVVDFLVIVVVVVVVVVVSVVVVVVVVDFVVVVGDPSLDCILESISKSTSTWMVGEMFVSATLLGEDVVGAGRMVLVRDILADVAGTGGFSSDFGSASISLSKPSTAITNPIIVVVPPKTRHSLPFHHLFAIFALNFASTMLLLFPSGSFSPLSTTTTLLLCIF